MSDAGTQQDKATLTIGDRTAEFPVLPRHRRHPERRPLDLHPPDRPHGSRLRLREHRGHRSRRSPTSTATRASCATAATRSSSSRQNSTYLEVAWLLIYGELPTADELAGVRRADPPPHPPARGPQALLLRAAAHRAPDVGALLGGLGALDLLRAPVRPAQPRARRAQHDPHAREAAGDRGVRAQEEHRAGVPLPRQLAGLRRQLPQAQLRRPLRGVRGQPGDVARARAPADPARGPRAERVDLDGAAGRLDRREPVLVDLGRHQRALRAAARRRERGRARHARRASATPARACSASSSASRTRRTASSSWASATGSTRTTTRARSS